MGIWNCFILSIITKKINVDILKPDLCILGGGAGGLSVAAGAVQMGASVVLIEAQKMGGDCLNSGCIPSKSLLASAKLAHLFRNAHQYGIQSTDPKIDFEKVMAHVHGVVQTIGVHDSVERFEKLGVKVIEAQGTFADKNTVIAGGTTIKARRFVIATGSLPFIPPIPGLDQVSFYTNETIFNLMQQPEHLIVIGGGAIGCELAQAFLMLGSKVTILEAFHLLPRDEKDLVALLRAHFLEQGLNIHENIKIKNVQQQDQRMEIIFEKNGAQHTMQGSHVLVATGRRPSIEGLYLEKAGVRYSKKGIEVDTRLRTSNKHIFAIGDVIGGYQFTHMANYHAGIVIRNALLRLPAKTNHRAIPWVIYTEPELAHVGLSNDEAIKIDSNAKILQWDFKENDRAQTEHQIFGKIKVMTTAKGKILGVSILGAYAGELLMPWISAVQEKKHIRSMTNFIVPYPTLSEISKRVASEFYTPLLFSKHMRWIVKLLSYFNI